MIGLDCDVALPVHRLEAGKVSTKANLELVESIIQRIRNKEIPQGNPAMRTRTNQLPSSNARPLSLESKIHIKSSKAMLKSTFLKSVSNSFLLVVPALVVNLFWASRLPLEWQFNVLWRDIPPAMAYGERISSLIVNILPVFMPLSISTLRQKKGLVDCIVGMLAYVAAWIMMVYFPQARGA